MASPYATGVLTLFAAAGTAAVFLFPLARLAVAGLVALLLFLYLVAGALDGKADIPILLWVLAFPLGYYFASLPRERAIFTLDRGIVLLVFAAVLFAQPSESSKVPEFARRSAFLWGCFVAATAATITKAPDVLIPTRILVDAFVLPSILGWYIIRRFDVRRHLTVLHAAACIMLTYVALIAAAELLTGEDLLPLPGHYSYFAGSVLRANGPFSSPNSLALIGIIGLLFLRFTRQAIGPNAPLWQRGLHVVGCAGAVAAALAPMFRSVAISIFVIVLLDVYFQRTVRSVLTAVAVVGCGVVAIAVLMAKAPDALEDRTDASNIYSRIAEQQRAINIFESSPLFGVGLTRFPEAADALPNSAVMFKGSESGRASHNSLLNILAETGLVGFVPYVASQVLLLLGFRELVRTGSAQARLVWITFLCIFAAYWVNGMSLISVYYSDLNLWFMFVIAFLLKYVMTEPAVSAAPLYVKRARWTSFPQTAVRTGGA